MRQRENQYSTGGFGGDQSTLHFSDQPSLFQLSINPLRGPFDDSSKDHQAKRSAAWAASKTRRTSDGQAIDVTQTAHQPVSSARLLDRSAGLDTVPPRRIRIRCRPDDRMRTKKQGPLVRAALALYRSESLVRLAAEANQVACATDTQLGLRLGGRINRNCSGIVRSGSWVELPEPVPSSWWHHNQNRNRNPDRSNRCRSSWCCSMTYGIGTDDSAGRHKTTCSRTKHKRFRNHSRDRSNRCQRHSIRFQASQQPPLSQAAIVATTCGLTAGARAAFATMREQTVQQSAGLLAARSSFTATAGIAATVAGIATAVAGVAATAIVTATIVATPYGLTAGARAATATMMREQTVEQSAGRLAARCSFTATTRIAAAVTGVTASVAGVAAGWASRRIHHCSSSRPRRKLPHSIRRRGGSRQAFGREARSRSSGC